MNNAGRKAIAVAVEQLEQLKATAQVVSEEISNLQSEEQDKFDNMPEGLQQGDAGCAMEAAADALQSAVDGYDELESAIDEMISNLETASE